MLDAELQIVDSVVVDLSENAEQLSTPFDLGRRGFPMGACFIVHLEDVTLDDTVDPVKFVLQVAVDDGTVFHDVAVIDLQGNDGASLAGPFSVPIGVMDFRAEIRSATDITVRVAVRYTDGTATDNLTYSAYIGTGNPYPHFASAAVYHE
jgi:hypothetical protein